MTASPAILALLLVGCATPGVSSEPTRDPVPRLVPQAWAFGGQGEPASGAVDVAPPCWGAFSVLRVEQGGALVSLVFDWQPATGAASKGQVFESEKATGTFQGRSLVLEGEHLRTVVGAADASEPAGIQRTAVHFELVYDPRSQHFVGTRNGARFWAAPSTTVPGACPPSP